MDHAALYQAIGALLEDQPDVKNKDQFFRWLGRAQALVSKVSSSWASEIQVASTVRMYSDPWGVRDQTNAILYRALAVVELDAPVQQQGTFIQSGNDLDALAGVAKSPFRKVLSG
jgi:hypothetical protein